MLNFEMLTLSNVLNEDIKKGLEMRVQMLYPQMSLHLTNMQCHSGRHIKTFDNIIENHAQLHVFLTVKNRYSKSILHCLRNAFNCAFVRAKSRIKSTIRMES